MLRYAVIAAAGALFVAGAATSLIALASGHAAAEGALRGAQLSDPAFADARVPKGPDGHFWAQGAANGASVRFLVDTGASDVFLTSADAGRLGLDMDGLVYDMPIHTAGGDSLAARVRLTSVSIAGVRVRDVDALVIGRGLTASLLGMSYLGRLSRFEATPDALILRP